MGMVRLDHSVREGDVGFQPVLIIITRLQASLVAEREARPLDVAASKLFDFWSGESVSIKSQLGKC